MHKILLTIDKSRKQSNADQPDWIVVYRKKWKWKSKMKRHQWGMY